MRYSLATYKITVTSTDEVINSFLGVDGQGLTIGGQGQAIGSIELKYDQSQWSLKSYSTGGYVHDRNLSRAGTVSVSINQLAPEIAVLKNVCKAYYNVEDYGGLTISLTGMNGDQIALCRDCFIEVIPEQSFGESASDQSWSFLCGEITFN